jgi:class 3 adenylate cyclase/CHASE2 domain-containing sensor protein
MLKKHLTSFLSLHRTLVSSLVVLFGVLLLLQNPFWTSLENQATDMLFWVSHRWTGPRVSPELVFEGIDDRSRDPAYSPNADERGRGGWWTKSHYSVQVNLHSNQFHPRVLAYDLLFQQPQNRTQTAQFQKIAGKILRPNLQEGLFTLQQLEDDGRLELQSQMLEASATGIGFVMAYEPPTDESAIRRLWDQSQDQTAAFQKLSTQSFPAACIQNGERLPAQMAVRLPCSEILETDALLGPVDVPRDDDGLVRRVPLVKAVQWPDGRRFYVPGFALAALLAYERIAPGDLKPWGQGVPSLSIEPGQLLKLQTARRRIAVPIDAQGRLYLKPRAKLQEFANVSYVGVTDFGLRLVNAKAIEQGNDAVEKQRLAQAQKLQEQLRDKILVIAESGTGSMDSGNYALETNVSNGLAHLLVLDNLLRGDTVRPARFYEVLLLLGIMTFFAGIVFPRLSPGWAGMVCGGLLLATPPLVGFCQMEGGLTFPLLAPCILVLLLTGLQFYHSYGRANVDRQQVRRFFSQMVSPRVLEQLERNPKLAALGGVRRDATMFFSDIAGFTTISEKLSPPELSHLLNRYLTPMTDIILEEDGYLDKYSGDGIMAVWGVPGEDPDHAVKACRAALRQAAKIETLAREIQAETGLHIGVRMGLNSGVVSAGNMGSESKFQYTVMGDAVNLAARLEPTNKDYGTTIIIGHHTRELAGNTIHTRLLDLLVVKGKTEPVRIYELIGMRQNNEPTPAWAVAYEDGFAFMLRRVWDSALKNFRLCQTLRGQDQASETLIARVQDFIDNPPPSEWNGSYVRNKKD